MSNNRRNVTLLTAAVVLAVFTAVCAVEFPSLPLLAPASQAVAADVASGDSLTSAGRNADQLLAAAIRRVLACSSIVTRMEYSTITPAAAGSGYYLEKGALLRRLELKLRGVEQASLLQISNGRMLWTRCTTQRETMTSETKPPTPLHSPQMHLAELGLPGLLAQLKAEYDLVLVGAGKLADEDVFVLKGVLKRDTLVSRLPQHAAEIRSGAFSAWSELPEGTPAALIIALGREDAVPRRIQFHAITDGAALAAWPKLETHETRTIDLRDVQLNQPIASATFVHP
ncbi:hypothetical protein [Blastopirellula marina]|uniref:DUF2092 domain-containing protein n=1 Tax=Blastopirellula marina DSM 3645 TaxID=314230 RepID=A3ZZH2_9BACT|nr:hypothetical protein [Blastopirellula marina]EAQ78135.1 hypothetical protein DSM3645_18981 [Blastopirellula marina DSM 3645]